MGATGALLAAGGPQVLAPIVWRQAGASADPPLAPHLEFGSNPAHEMTVSWLTTSAVQHPRVRFGPARRELDEVVPAETVTYLDSHVNPSAPTEAFTQHATLTGLRPDTTYIYEVSHEGAAPVQASFRTAPQGRRPFRFTSFGDQSIPPDAVNNPTNSLPWTRYAGLIVPQIEAAHPLFHLYNGDLSYANVRPAGVDRSLIWRSFLSNNSQSARNRPWMPAAGNHEDESGNSNSAPAGTYFPNYLSYQTYFNLPANGSQEFHGLWYAFRVGSMLVISLNNDDVCYQNGSAGNGYLHGYSGGQQKAFLQKTLREARASDDVDWIVVVMHQVAMSTAIPFNGSELGIRQEWLPLFDQYGVDLVFTGHEHHYERTFAVRGQQGQYSQPIAATHEMDSIDTTKGTVHMILGGGGHSSPSHNLYAIDSSTGFFESELLVPDPHGTAATPTISPKPRELATWSPTMLAAPNPTSSTARDSFHGYGFATFDVDPGSDAGSWTTIDVRYHRVLDPSNPADAGKVIDYDAFQLRRRRGDSGEHSLTDATAATIA